MIPSNHRQAERQLISLVLAGEWEIDSAGRIWRLSLRTGSRWRPGSRLSPCERRRAEKFLPSGYGMVRAMIAGKRVCGLAHRLVWQNAHGDIPDGLVINHKNGLKDDNRPENLEIATYGENSRHAYRVGLRDEHGERNPAAHLSDHDIGAIRAAYAAGGVTMAGLASRFGCSFQHVSDVVRGRARKKQPGPVSQRDLRHSVCERDAETGRFVGSLPMLDGRQHAEWPGAQ